jgi:hypothetical protein
MQIIANCWLANILISLAFVLALEVPAGATDFEEGGRFQNLTAKFNMGGVSARVGLGAARSGVRSGHQFSHRYHRRRETRRRYNRSIKSLRPHDRVILVPVRERKRVVEQEPTPQIPPTPKPAEDVTTTVPKPEPLDLAGYSRIVSARGLSGQRIAFAPGDILPFDVPHVTLSAKRYDLPEPGPGEIYARVRQTVLRINATTRKVIAIVTR